MKTHNVSGLKKIKLGALVIAALCSTHSAWAESYVGDSATYRSFVRGRVPAQFMEKFTILAYDPVRNVFKEEIVETAMNGSVISRRIQDSTYYGAEAGAQKYYFYECQKNTNGTITRVTVPAGSLLSCSYFADSPYSNAAYISFGQVPFGTIRYQEANGNFVRELVSYEFGQR